jgi:hypothetical protein
LPLGRTGTCAAHAAFPLPDKDATASACTEKDMLGTILIIILILALIGALPTWGHSRSWGYFPSGGLGLILVILIILVLLGRI